MVEGRGDAYPKPAQENAGDLMAMCGDPKIWAKQMAYILSLGQLVWPACAEAPCAPHHNHLLQHKTKE